MATITTELVDTGAKRDGRGRRLATAIERAALLLAYRRSGLTQRAFAEREGIKYCTFTSWVQGRRQVREPGAKARFAEVAMAVPGPVAGLSIHWPDGVVTRGANAGEVVELVRALRG